MPRIEELTLKATMNPPSWADYERVLERAELAEWERDGALRREAALRDKVENLRKKYQYVPGYKMIIR